MFVRNMQHVTLSVFIVSQQMFVSAVWAVELIQDERFIEFGCKCDRICGKVQQNILKERAHIPSSLLEYAVVLVYLKMAACALVLPWMGSNPSSDDDGKVLSSVDGDLKQQGPRWTQTHPMWPRDICQWNGHIFWHSTACKWSQMRCGSPTVCFPILLVLGLWWAWLFWLWFRVFFGCLFVFISVTKPFVTQWESGDLSGCLCLCPCESVLPLNCWSSLLFIRGPLCEIIMQ